MEILLTPFVCSVTAADAVDTVAVLSALVSIDMQR